MAWLEALVFGLLSLLLQWLAGLSGRYVLLIVVGLLAFSYGMGHLLQKRLIHHLKTRPNPDAPLGRLEATFSLLGPLALLYFLLVRIVKAIRGWLRKRKEGEQEGTLSKEKAAAPAKPVRVATLGPSFFFAGLLTGVIFWLAWLTDPLFARAFGISPGHSYWQYLLLGQRPEFAWVLPLEDQPLLAVVLCLVLALTLWWTLGNVLRGLVYRSDLQHNHGQAPLREVEGKLPIWASGFGVVGLTEPGASYKRWASWMAAAAILLTAVAGLMGEDGRIAPSALALGLVVTLSWVLHLRMEGFATPPESAEKASKDKGSEPLSGWPQVEEELRQLHGYSPAEHRFERPISPLRPSIPARSVPTLSPLAAELLSGMDGDPETSQEPQLTDMQHKLLESLSLFGYVHLPPPTDDEELKLVRSGAQEVENRSGLTERHQVVLAPEGSGKTTLAMLAAANHALVHARATLIVTRSEAQAAETAARIHAAVEPSTMRWNLRLRRLGRDFASDLSRDVIPDVVVVSLHQLVTGLLDDHEVYTPFLREVGLVVVDDVESFAGAVEIHAQLAFRRLRLLFRQLAGVEQLGEDNEPLMLVLGVDTMKQTATWAQNLCGIQASVRPFSAPAAPGDGADGGEQPMRQVGYRLGDLRAGSGRRLTVAEVVAACEARGVPWHYRPAGDGRRHLGLGPLLLDREPAHACPSPRTAGVVLLEGRWGEIRRELRRLPWAGSESGRSEIAVLTVLEAEEEEACEALDPAFGLSPEEASENVSDLAEQLAALPLPILRPPSTLAVQNHLLSDLLQEWIEVKDLVDAFGAPVARSLRRLRSQGMLYTEERRDVKPELKEYEPKVYVRALVTSLSADEAPEDGEEGIIELSPYDKVRQVELVSPRAVRVCNRLDQKVLRRVEADSAGSVYYRGRVFEDSRGRFVVVDRVRKGQQVSDVEVEPALRADLSSPRRRFDVSRDPSIATPYPLFEPELMLLGPDPVEIGLVGVRATLRSVGTYRLNRFTGEVLSRELHESRTIQELFSPAPLETVALVLIPNPGKSPAHAPLLRFGEARLLATLLRYLLPLVYRDTRDHVEVALAMADHDGSGQRASDEPLGPEDAFYILDLHQGGNGISRAVHRDGLGLLLRFCRHFLETVTDFSRLRRLYDHWGDLDEILADGRLESEQEAEEPMAETAGDGEEPAGEVADGESDEELVEESLLEESLLEESLPSDSIPRGLLEWLDSRLHSEALAEAIRDRDPEAAGSPDGADAAEEAA